MGSTMSSTKRLSSNWIVDKVATFYIETVRNIPVLVQIIFWQVVVRGLGALERDSGISFFGAGEPLFYASAKGFALPWFDPTETRWQWVVIFAICLVGVVRVYRWRIAVCERIYRGKTPLRHRGVARRPDDHSLR